MRHGRLALRLAVIVLLDTAGSLTAHAQESNREPSWIIKEGLGLSYHMHQRNSDERLLIFAPEIAKPVGRHWEYVLEGELSRYTSPPGYVAGLCPIGARYFPLAGAGPFVSLGLGFGWTDLTNIPEISRRFNFLAEGDLGFRWKSRRGRPWQISGRFSHISNAGTVRPNLGLNLVVLLFGCGLN